MSDPVGLLLVLVGIALNVGAQVALKLAVEQRAGVSWSDPAGLARLALDPWVILGLALYAASVVNWLVVLKRLDLSLAYPLMSIGYIATFWVGVWWFGEPVSATRLIGIAVIILGVIFLTRPVAP
jgi:multidrug transporter EmrE-like cation transporter